jgi:hypothetical protein
LWRFSISIVVGDRRDHILKVHPDPPRLHDQLFDFLLQQALAVASARPGGYGDDRADARMHFQPALLNQVLNDLMSRVGVDFQVGRQRTDRWERLTRLVFTTQECLLRGEQQLLDDRLAGTKREAK